MEKKAAKDPDIHVLLLPPFSDKARRAVQLLADRKQREQINETGAPFLLIFSENSLANFKIA